MLSVFSTYASSIFLEGFFFLLVGSLVSGIIEVFVPESLIRSIIPKNRVLAILISTLVGIVFPFCECGIVPIVARLMRKGVPVSCAVTMLLSIPIVNIIVFSSTAFAFRGMEYMAFLRISGGILISFIIGMIIQFFMNEKKIIAKNRISVREIHSVCGCGSHHSSSLHPTACTHSSAVAKKRTFAGDVKAVIDHAVHDFFGTGKYFIAGILITSAFQTFIPHEYLNEAGKNFPAGPSVMIAFSYLLSICSQTDAFIAKSFSGIFTAGSLLAFMISGAMIDVKTTLMMKRLFSLRFIFFLAVMIFSFNLIFSYFVNLALR